MRRAPVVAWLCLVCAPSLAGCDDLLELVALARQHIVELQLLDGLGDDLRREIECHVAGQGGKEEQSGEFC